MNSGPKFLEYGGEAEGDGKSFSVKVRRQGRGALPRPPELALRRHEGPHESQEVSPFENAPVLVLCLESGPL